MPKRSSSTVCQQKPKNQKKILLTDLIEVYDNVLDLKTCKSLIGAFESNTENHEIIDADKKPSFTQFNLTQNLGDTPELKNLHDHIIMKTFEYKKNYYDHVDERVFPESHNFEYYRIKKYRNNGEDLFDTHVDIKDHESSRRFLSFLFYLNTVKTGGETIFEGMTINPKAGRLVIFPPMWMFPHKGCCPISNDKYILTTYLHYK
jgi:hypothetical protein